MNRVSISLLTFLLASLVSVAQSSLQLTNLVAAQNGSAADFELVLSSHVANTSSEDLSVKAKRMVLPGGGFSSQNYFCWDACYDPSQSTSIGGITIAAGESFTYFTGHLRPFGYVGTTSIRYCFFNEASPSDSVCFIGRFETAAVGINEIPAVASVLLYPNPAAEFTNLTWTLPAPLVNGRIEIMNMLGSKVLSMSVTGQSGQVSIPVSELESGIYFYSLNSDGQPKRTGKFNVKH